MGTEVMDFLLLVLQLRRVYVWRNELMLGLIG